MTLIIVNVESLAILVGIAYLAGIAFGYLLKDVMSKTKPSNTIARAFHAMAMLQCRIGWHDWTKPSLKHEVHRRCLRCGKEQELTYDFLAPYWRDCP